MCDQACEPETVRPAEPVNEPVEEDGEEED